MGRRFSVCTVIAAVMLMTYASRFMPGQPMTMQAVPHSLMRQHTTTAQQPQAQMQMQQQPQPPQSEAMPQELPQPATQPPPSRDQVRTAPAEQKVPPQDGSLEAALRLAVPEGQLRFVLVTFGNKGVQDHLLNFVDHVKSVGAAHVVGAVDTAVFELLVRRGTPVYKTPLASESYQMDGSNQHSSGSWKKFAGMRTVRSASAPTQITCPCVAHESGGGRAHGRVRWRRSSSQVTP